MDGMGNAEAAGDDPIELEEKYHDIDTMVSMACIEHELGNLDKILQKYRN